MGQLRHILVHSASAVQWEDGARPADASGWVEGEPNEGAEAAMGLPFPCVLFLPLGSEDTDRPRSRKVSVPTLMWEPINADTGDPVEPLNGDDSLIVTAAELVSSFEELAGYPGAGLWQIDGNPQPFGPPGRVIGYQARLKQVTG